MKVTGDRLALAARQAIDGEGIRQFEELVSEIREERLTQQGNREVDKKSKNAQADDAAQSDSTLNPLRRKSMAAGQSFSRPNTPGGEFGLQAEESLTGDNNTTVAGAECKEQIPGTDRNNYESAPRALPSSERTEEGGGCEELCINMAAEELVDGLHCRAQGQSHPEGTREEKEDLVNTVEIEEYQEEQKQELE